MSREAYPDLIEALSNFSTTSFTELQAAAYIALVKMGEESGSAVAKESGINRSKIYDILNQLVDMNAVKKVSRDGKNRYLAVSPEEFFPQLLARFQNDMKTAQSSLEAIQDLEEEVDPVKFTFKSLTLDDIDTNNFQYLISTNEKCRVQFTEKLAKGSRPGNDVRIFDLNDYRDVRGLVMLVSDKEAYLFGSPRGKKVEAIHISSGEIAYFLVGVIESKWVKDIPPNIQEEIDTGQRNALVVDKAISMRYEMTLTNQEYVYKRPVSMLITDEHISFFFEGEEFPKIPLISLSKVEIDGGLIRVRFTNTQNQLIGELTMKIVGNPLYIKNILDLIKLKNTK